LKGEASWRSILASSGSQARVSEPARANLKAYNRQLSRLIERDRVKPSWIVSHELPLEQAPQAYKNFDQRKDGWTKVVLKPGK